MDKIKSTGILINKTKLMDKIKCEIKTATAFKGLYKDKGANNQDWKYFNGKVNALMDLEQWINDLDKDKRLTGTTDGYEDHLKQGVFPKNLEKEV